VNSIVDLTGPQKAVLMLLSLDEATAAPITSELDEEDLRKLQQVASTMRAVPAGALAQVYAEFVERSNQAVAVPRGGVRYLRRIATRALGEARAREIFSETQQSPIDRLANADPETLSGVLEHEHPQLVAAILSQLPADRAANLVERLPEELQTDVLERLATMTEVPQRLLQDVAQALSAELPATEAEGSTAVDGIAQTAALVRRMGQKLGDALLARLSGADETLATEIRRAMYTFEDLKLLDARGLRSLLEAVPADRLTLAMKTATDALKNHIFSAMSKRAAERVREDLEMLGGVRLADVEAAQQEIVEQCLKLAAEGVISLENSDAVV
jgi:flagellar motor switch protein FliG